VVEGVATATRASGAAGARSASQGAQLDALALAQLSGALRLVSADAQAAVEEFADPQLLASGRVNLISVEAVQLHFGAQWGARRQQVFAFASRVLARNFGGRGVHLRVSDSDFFIVHRDAGRLAAQAACLRCLREILTRFVGDAAQAVSGVMQVTAVRPGRLETEPADALGAEAALARGETEAAAGDLPGFPGEEVAAAGRLNPWTPFVSVDGRRLRVSATLEPVYEVKHFTRIGFRMIRRVIVVASGEELTARQIAALSPADLLRADLATITRGVDRLNGEGAGERQLSLIVPVSYSSLASQRGRTELMAPIREAAAMVKLGAICEIVDLEGVPAGALLAATSLVRPLSLLVAGRLTAPPPGAFARLAGAGLQAVSFECPKAEVSDGEFIGWATATIAAAKKVAKSVLVYGAGTTRRAGILASLGATHVSLVAG